MTQPVRDLVAAAGQLLTPPPGTLPGLTPALEPGLTPALEPALTPGLRARAAAALLRLALDEAMDDFWRSTSPGMVHSRGRTKALCLEWYASPSVARRWYVVRSALSAACHHHTYELPPTPAEVRAWHADVTELLRAMPSDTAAVRP